CCVLTRLRSTVFSSIFLVLLRPPTSTLFPYTTLFRSGHSAVIRPHYATHRERQGIARARDDARIERVYLVAEQRRQVVARIRREDRKSTRLNSSHVSISYAVFCLKKKKEKFCLT